MAGSATTYEENLALGQSAMGRYADAPLPHLIAGRRVLSRSGETFTNHSPIDGRAPGDVAAGEELLRHQDGVVVGQVVRDPRRLTATIVPPRC